MYRIITIAACVGLFSLAAPASASLAKPYTPTTQISGCEGEVCIEVEIEGNIHVLEEEKVRGVPIPLAVALSILPHDLYVGIEDAGVLVLEHYLENKGYELAPDTYFSPETRAALADFQKMHTITPAQGYFGPKTKAFIASEL